MKAFQCHIRVIHDQQDSSQHHENSSGEVDLDAEGVSLNQRVIPRETGHSPLDEQRNACHRECIAFREESRENEACSDNYDARPDQCLHSRLCTIGLLEHKRSDDNRDDSSER